MSQTHAQPVTRQTRLVRSDIMDGSSDSNVRLAKGQHSRLVNVREDGTIELGKKAYVDDMAALIADAATGTAMAVRKFGPLNAKFDLMAAGQNLLIYVFDAAAQAQHGYSGSAEEAALNISTDDHLERIAKARGVFNAELDAYTAVLEQKLRERDAPKTEL